MIVSALKHHPKAVCFNELFNQEIVWGYSERDDWGMRPDLENIIGSQEQLTLRNQDPAAFIKGIFSHCFNKNTAAVGFKVFYDHERNLENCESLWPSLSQDRSIDVIWLRRKSLISNYYSMKTAEATGVWVYNSENYYDNKIKRIININVPSFLMNAGKLLGLEEDRGALFKNHRIHELWYENIIDDFNGSINKIQNFLDLPPILLGTSTFRQNTHQMSDVIENYEEVQHALINAGFGDRI